MLRSLIDEMEKSNTKGGRPLRNGWPITSEYAIAAVRRVDSSAPEFSAATLMASLNGKRLRQRNGFRTATRFRPHSLGLPSAATPGARCQQCPTLKELRRTPQTE
jgi:hypothetical protein